MTSLRSPPRRHFIADWALSGGCGKLGFTALDWAVFSAPVQAQFVATQWTDFRAGANPVSALSSEPQIPPLTSAQSVADSFPPK
jgi:non-ribosomal peptide synthetase component E (peptide arylation enzyme)